MGDAFVKFIKFINDSYRIGRMSYSSDEQRLRVGKGGIGFVTHTLDPPLAYPQAQNKKLIRLTVEVLRSWAIGKEGRYKWMLPQLL